MTRKKRRLYVLLVAAVLLGGATALVIGAFRGNLVFFFSPTEIVEKNVEPGQRIRVGGLVEEDSVVHDADGLTVHFRVTDLSHAVMVTYRGILPSLFREHRRLQDRSQRGHPDLHQCGETDRRAHRARHVHPQVCPCNSPHAAQLSPSPPTPSKPGAPPGMASTKRQTH